MKKVAIVGWSTGPNSFGIGKYYMDFIVELGGQPIVLMPNMTEEIHRELAKNVDLLILPGGADLSPHHYGEDPGAFTGNPDVFKENFFTRHLKTYIEAGTPIFGICLGFQMLNVFFGGKLVQHLKYTDIHASDRRGVEAHKVLVSDNLREWDGYQRLEGVAVNSHHHQAVTFSNLGKGLVPNAFSNEFTKAVLEREVKKNEDILIEGFIHESLPIAGVQWHPEEWYEPHSRRLINSIIRQAKEKNVKS